MRRMRKRHGAPGNDDDIGNESGRQGGCQPWRQDERGPQASEGRAIEWREFGGRPTLQAPEYSVAPPRRYQLIALVAAVVFAAIGIGAP